MADRELLGLAASAKVGGHPIHPMLVPFPIALLVATFVSDLVYLTNGNAFWADVSMWSLGAAIVTAALAALAGLTDFMGNARIRAINDAWKHMIGNIVVVLLSIASFWLRYDGGPVQAVWPGGFLLSLLTVLLLLYTGWKGGELVYHHRIGMHPEAEDGTTPPPTVKHTTRHI
ncbi:DUF2231 domain-containing protein [Sinorhizobium medicae]|uniref:DUF2231 domain-containing protein n=1 Tax=Sinorhizobium medicae TaxID=110321 RepID=UPI000C7DC79D|nr:DUF2231 domain-containing protein [Sinorhizobium medicae]MDX0445039.1 DUF2231 domain-containing protein [Sinorhizobium medicae]MDX0494012.1 DUF2231 domain-containing protein [Sinorhizobium medicae]MDX0543270.1 DUF2231 domain-containing protein [Sinorhizobium medicae]MDX0719028.1 DUF2231 domain-containing protein [Sinorhizobium medicae]MDX0758702.1 DUF2231 domain-containing protein [Sinorhizobium medicae]